MTHIWLVVKYSAIFHPTNWMMIPIDFHMLLSDVKGCCTTTSAEVLTRCFWCCCRFWFRSRTFSHYVLNVCTPVWASSLSKNWGKSFVRADMKPLIHVHVPKSLKSLKQPSVLATTFSKMVWFPWFFDDLKMFKDAQSIATITRPCFLVYSWSLHL